MRDDASGLNQRIGGRVRELRAATALSLDALANKSGVSRSMISLIERGECSPTAVVLEKLAAAFSVTLGLLFESPSSAGNGTNGPLVRRDDQPQWKDPESGYVRRNISPPGVPQPIQMTEVHFPAGGRVAFEKGARQTRVHQQVWVLEGAIDITLDAAKHRLGQGDCLAMDLDGPVMFHNPTPEAARYVVVTACEITGRRR